MSDAKNPVSIRERKYIKNPLLHRRQFVLEVIHPGRANLSRADLQSEIAKVTNRSLCGFAPRSLITFLMGITFKVCPEDFKLIEF